MILLIDAGNTRIKWRVVDARTLLASGTLTTTEVANLQRIWQAFELTQAWISCVANAPVSSRLAQMLDQLGVHANWLVAERESQGLINLYEHPAQLGGDRYAGMIAAARLKVGDCLVVSVGTATTVDMLSRDAEFWGGVIIPGPDLMRSSLLGATAQVESRMQQAPESVLTGHLDALPRNTEMAVGMGIALAQAGVVHALCDRMQRIRAAQIHAQESALPRVILTGGARAQVRDWLRPEVIEIEDLVLEGLAWIALEALTTVR